MTGSAGWRKPANVDFVNHRLMQTPPTIHCRGDGGGGGELTGRSAPQPPLWPLMESFVHRVEPTSPPRVHTGAAIGVYFGGLPPHPNPPLLSPHSCTCFHLLATKPAVCPF